MRWLYKEQEGKVAKKKKNYFVLAYNESGVNIEGNNTFHLFML